MQDKIENMRLLFSDTKFNIFKLLTIFYLLILIMLELFSDQ